MCDKYLLSYYKEVVTDILRDIDDSKHFPLNINFVELSGNDPNLGNNFLRDPEKSLKEWNEALCKVQTELMSKSQEGYTFKKNTHCRIHSLPTYPELHRTKFPQNDDTNKFLQITGTVVRMTAVKMLEYQRQYLCTKCKYVMVVNAEYEMKNMVTPPRRCMNPEECTGTNIVSVGELNAEFCKDYQEIKMQETVSKLEVGSMPNSMWVTLEDDLVDSCKPGDNVTVCGLVKKRQNQFVVGKKIEVEIAIKANHIQVNNTTSALSLTPELKDMFKSFWKTYADEPLAARDIILKSICPELFGLFIVKLAVAVVLAGGSNLHAASSTGVRVRTEPHLLLVGDPGTGKSQLLRFASKIIPRSVLTTGVGSTAAGLTVAAVMENGEWQLEGGALVMSDGGICCIDEFNTMKEHDRTSIHEAMEQQTISVAKASIVCKLSTRCSILAATNPKGNLDPSQPLNMNVALASPLLSRFDLILLLRDKVDEEWDCQLVDFIFNSFENCNSSKLSESINWSIETLQAYFAVIKKIHPVLTEDANRILSGYYQAQRQKQCRNKSRTTVRLLDSLVRLSQGHARLMYHEQVEIVDAITAVILVETAESPIFNLGFNLRNDFPKNANTNYRELVEVVLTKLNLTNLLEKELERINLNKKPPSGSGSDMGKSNSFHAGIKSKFFQVQKIVEDDIIEEKSGNNEGKSKGGKEEMNDNLSHAGQSEHVEIQKSELLTHTHEFEVKEQDDVNISNIEIDDIIKNGKRKKDTVVFNPKKLKVSKENEFQQGDKIKIIDVLQTCSSRIIDKDITVTRETKGENEEGPKLLSQRTRTRNFFSRFKFIPKQNEYATVGSEDKSLEKNVSGISLSTYVEKDKNRSNSVRISGDQFSDVSFLNVVASTQLVNTSISHEEKNDPCKEETSVANVEPNSDLNTLNGKSSKMKKFSFKKENSLRNVKLQIPALDDTSSIFETQDDLDSLDFDI